MRFRKLGNFCVESPLIWHTFHTGEEMLAMARYFLGDDIIVKFNSVFVKPAKTGSATPWHQDNGLWRDGETEPFNAWMGPRSGDVRKRVVCSSFPAATRARSCRMSCMKTAFTASCPANSSKRGSRNAAQNTSNSTRAIVGLLAQQPVALQPAKPESQQPHRHCGRVDESNHQCRARASPASLGHEKQGAMHGISPGNCRNRKTANCTSQTPIPKPGKK